MNKDYSSYCPELSFKGALLSFLLCAYPHLVCRTRWWQKYDTVYTLPITGLWFSFFPFWSQLLLWIIIGVCVEGVHLAYDLIFIFIPLYIMTC